MEFSRSMQAHDGDRYQIQGKSPSYDYTNWSPSDYGKNQPWSWDAERRSGFPRRDTSACYMESSRTEQAHEVKYKEIQGKSPWFELTNRESSHTGGHQPHQARAQPPAHRYLTPKRAGYKAAAKRTHPSDPSNEQFSRMTKETTKHKLTQPTVAKGVEIVYTKNIFEAETWLRTHITDCSASAVGFDIEWKPQFVSKKRGGTENKTAVLQLGVDTSCLVLHIHHMSKLPNLLVSILEDATVLKIGSGIKQDMSKLRRDRGLVCHGIVDTQDVAKSLDPSSTQKVGLKALAERFLGITLAKSKRVSTSNWENFPLTLRQIEYAALDAWLGLKVFNAIEQSKGSQVLTSLMKQKVHHAHEQKKTT